MRKTVFHVGFGKSGSSAIQRSLLLNTETLRAAGIRWCDIWLLKKTVGDRGFETIADFERFMGTSPVEDIVQRLVAIFDEANPAFGDATTVIWSNEALAMRWALIGPLIEEFFRPQDVTVLIYFRNQIDWLVSAYLQWSVKDKQMPGRVRDWDRFVQATESSLDYENIIRCWQGVIKTATFLPRSYDMAPSIVDDFFAAIGVTVPLKDTASRIYETPGYTAHALFKIYNDQFDGPQQPEPLQSLMANAGVLGREFHPVDPCPVDVPAAALDRLASKYEPMNERLSSEYGITLKRGRTSAIVGRRQHTTTDNTDLVAALLMMISRLDQQVRTLNAAVEALGREQARAKQ